MSSQRQLGFPHSQPSLHLFDFANRIEIYTVNVEEALQGPNPEIRRITQNLLIEEHLDWSPDGKYIAFHVTAYEGNTEIYMVNIEDFTQWRLTRNARHDRNPTWAPDGCISFETNRDGNFEIYMMNANGTSQTRITHNNYDDFAPHWSPDGKRIVFYSNRGDDGTLEIFYIDRDEMPFDGQEVIHRITRNTYDDLYPIWLPLSESE